MPRRLTSLVGKSSDFLLSPEYLAQASKVLYDGKPIRLPRPEE